ncbi:MAG: NosD domain-containing protein, partial [Candidatus Odinarchaeota archaeon]
QVINNTVNYNVQIGIYMDQSHDFNISGNKIYNNSRGIEIISCDNSNIMNNSINNNLDIGINLYNSFSNEIKNNTIYNNDLGIRLDSSNNNNITGNNLLDNNWCIYETYCVGNIIEYNDCSSPTIDLPIFIDGIATGVGAHNWTWAESQSWCTGSGTEEVPYVIENLRISGFGTEDYCIDIRNSNVSFIIRECLVYNSIEAGIYFDNVNNSIVVNNNCSNNDNGIYLEYSNNITILENTANDNNNDGIYVYSSNYINITANTANNNENDGIELHDYCDDNTISKNLLKNNYNGITIDNDCYYNNITGNTATGNDDGGIVLERDNDHNIITGNNFDGNRIGIKLYEENSFNAVVENNASNNSEFGIYLTYLCNNNSITENNVNGNGNNDKDFEDKVGIKLENNCHNNTIIGNNVNNNNETGILLHDYCTNNIISGNTIKNNSNGVKFDTNLYYNNIVGNSIEENSQYGIIYLGGGEESCDYNTITENILYDNTRGISLDPESNNNTIFENFFLANEIHAIDNGTDNKWNSTLIGNYWDNHTSPDINNDGIVDDPYIYISGSAGSIDYLPIAELSITINAPSAGSVFGIMAPSYDVTIIYIYEVTKWYTIDGGINNYTFTENGVINQSAWDALSDGNAIITFYARDLAGNTGSKEVLVQKDTQAPVITINSPASGDEFGNTPPSFNITVTDPNLDTIWYTVNNSITILGNILEWTIPQEVWDALPEGSTTIMVYANDTLGHTSSQSLSLTKNIPSSKGIGLDNFMIGVLITLFSSVAIVVVITKMYRKKQLT